MVDLEEIVLPLGPLRRHAGTEGGLKVMPHLRFARRALCPKAACAYEWWGTHRG